VSYYSVKRLCVGGDSPWAALNTKPGEIGYLVGHHGGEAYQRGDFGWRTGRLLLLKGLFRGFKRA